MGIRYVLSTLAAMRCSSVGRWNAHNAADGRGRSGFRVLVSVSIAVFILALILGSAVPEAAGAQESGTECEALIDAGWTDSEQKAWLRLCTGASVEEDDGASGGPSHDTGWSGIQRPSFDELCGDSAAFVADGARSEVSEGNAATLGADFVQQLLVGGEFQQALGNRPIRIQNALIQGSLELESVTVTRSLILEGSVVSGAINLDDVVFSGSIRLSGTDIADGVHISHSSISGNLLIDSAKIGAVELLLSAVGGSVVVEAVGVSGDIKLARSSILGDLDLLKLSIKGELSLNGSSVDGWLNIGYGGTKSEEARVSAASSDMVGLTVLRSISISRMVIHGRLNAYGMSVGGDLAMNWLDVKEVDLSGSIVGGDFRFSDSSVCLIEANGTAIGGGAEFLASRVAAATLEDSSFTDLSFAGALEVGSISVANSTVNHALVLWSESGGLPEWQDDAKFDLSRLEVGSVQDHSDGAWPKDLELWGLTYNAQSRTPGGFLDRDFEWYEAWLSSDLDSGPQPFQELERALDLAGRQSMANRIAVLRIDVERNSYSRMRKAMYVLWGLAIGYGYSPRNAIITTIVFWLLGMCFAHFSWAELKTKGAVSLPVFSLDRLIPLLEFSQGNGEVDIGRLDARWTRWYFYLHTVVGYLLGLSWVTALARLVSN